LVGSETEAGEEKGRRERGRVKAKNEKERKGLR
jgi:hypothetical protein